jgi:hypothetical protein
MLAWLKRLFTHTAEAPPPIAPHFPPAGLDRADPADMVVIEATRVVRPAPDLDVAPSVPAAPAAKAAPARPFGEAIDDDVYGLTFTIEYGAADGEVSRRRIMLRSISQRGGDTYLQALCFERNALRSFRLDRVIRVIDSDGQVFEDPPAYLRVELRVRLHTETPPASPRTAPRALLDMVPTPAPAAALLTLGAEPPGHAQRRCARDGLRVLVALARSDGMLHPAEVDVVLEYIAALCGRLGVACGSEDRAALAGYLRRQRPGLDVLEDCLARLDEASTEVKLLLLDFADRVVDADGLRHPEEHRVVAQIREALPA